MSKILHLDTSPRGERSHSRLLASEFIHLWKQAQPEDTVIYRDLGRQAVPHIDESWIAAAFTPEANHTPLMQKDLKISDELIAEFLEADRYVFSVPMYNLSIPSRFKAYIDQIVRVGKTFTPDMKGLVHGKKMLVLTSRGGVYLPDTEMGAFDFQEPYLRAIFGFMGVTDITFIHAQGVNMGDEARKNAMTSAREELEALVKTW